MSCLVKLKIIGKWLAVGQLEGAALNYPQITQIGFKNLCNLWRGIHGAPKRERYSGDLMNDLTISAFTQSPKKFNFPNQNA